MELNTLSLSLKPLRVRSFETQDYKQRLDPVLVRMVQESIQRRAPHLKVGKRVAVEAVLLTYLGDQNLLREYPELPGLLDRDPIGDTTKGGPGGT